MREHRWALEHMSDYLDDELASSPRRRMQRHTEKCAECRRVLAVLRRIVATLHRLPPSPGGADARRIAAVVGRRMAELPPRPD